MKTHIQRITRLTVLNRRYCIQMVRERKEIAEVTKENRLLGSSCMDRL